MKKLVLASVCTLALVGFVMADEFAATITKVDGNTVYFTKGKKDDKKEGKATADAKVKVHKGVFDMDTKTFKAGDAIEGGLKNEMFAKIDEKGVGVTITTDDKSGNITQIVTKGGKGAGGGKGGKKKG